LNFNECPHNANANVNEESKEYEEFKERSQEPGGRASGTVKGER
jgi:hypothetical protein